MATMQCFVRQDGNDEFGGKNLTSMALLPATNASSAGGPHSVVGEHHGRSTCSKIWLILVYLT